MTLMNISKCEDRAEWDAAVKQLNGHPLQLWSWGDLKSAHRWTAHRLLVRDEAGRAIGGAQVLQRQLPKPFGSVLYAPRGPIGESEVVLPLLTDYCRQHFAATHLSIEPHSTQPIGLAGWRSVKKALLLPHTIIIDLDKSEDELLADMTKKTRQYIRKSSKEGVVVREGQYDDLEACLAIYRQTAERAGFGLHADQYYLDIFEMMGEASRLFIAEVDDQIVAFVWLVATPEVAFELYGGMNELGQARRANYCLKWYAMTRLKHTGVRTYDVNGLLNDGVSTFKRGFASHETTLAGSYDYPLSAWYPIWTKAFPAAKKALQLLSSLRK